MMSQVNRVNNRSLQEIAVSTSCRHNYLQLNDYVTNVVFRIQEQNESKIFTFITENHKNISSLNFIKGSVRKFLNKVKLSKARTFASVSLIYFVPYPI